MQQLTETDDLNNNIELLLMSKEILIHIFKHLEDKDLLIASHVCKLFSSAAEIAFERKYSQKSYKIEGYDLKFHRVMLSKYGVKLSKIYTWNVSNSVLDLIEHKCQNLRSIELNHVPRIPNLKSLKKVKFIDVKNISKERVLTFIENNRELETLEFNGLISTDWIEMLHNRLPMLKHLIWLEFYGFIDLMINIQRITLHSLERLELFICQTDDLVRILRVMDCKNLRELKLERCTDSNDDLVNQIVKFQTLSSLKLINCSIPMEQMEKLAKHLPQLKEFATKINESKSNTETENEICSVLSKFPKLTKLRVSLKDLERFLSDFKNRSINEFHARFAERLANAEVAIVDDDGCEMLSISKDRIYVCDYDSMELHLMGNCNENHIRNTLIRTSSDRIFQNFKFIINCSNDLNISMISSGVKCLRCLEIKSKGPISVNTNVRGYNFGFDLNVK